MISRFVVIHDVSAGLFAESLDWFRFAPSCWSDSLSLDGATVLGEGGIGVRVDGVEAFKISCFS